jgi:hypothetical protein
LAFVRSHQRHNLHPPIQSPAISLTGTNPKPNLSNNPKPATLSPKAQEIISFISGDEINLSYVDTATWRAICKLIRQFVRQHPEESTGWGEMLSKVVEKVNALDVSLSTEQYENAQTAVELLCEILGCEEELEPPMVPPYMLLAEVPRLFAALAIDS